MKLKHYWINSAHEPYIRSFDPQLGHAHNFLKSPKGIKAIPGYDLWPIDLDSREAQYRIILLGGSTSDTWWSEENYLRPLSKRLNDAIGPTLLFNGGVCGYHSGQEFLKLCRDVPSIRPDVVLSLSGINEIVDHNVKGHPFFSTFMRDVGRFLTSFTSAFDNIDVGPSHSIDVSSVFLRHGRLMNVVAEEFNCKYLQILQPTLGRGDYSPKAFENEFIASAKDEYFDKLGKFYDEISAVVSKKGFEHVIDFSNIFVDEEGPLYKDLRHLNQQGNDILADKIFDQIKTLLE